MPDGYLHGGRASGAQSLSSGERQLIALARARLVDPAILLLDEATSNLDLATEARVQRAMGAGVAGPHDDPRRPPPADGAHRRPHRSSSTDGVIVEQGTHDELLAARRPLRRPLGILHRRLRHPRRLTQRPLSNRQ